MGNGFVVTLEYLDAFFDSILAETAIVLLLVGLIFLLIGLFIVIGTTITAMANPRVTGKVAGAIKIVEKHEKQKKGKLVSEIKEWLYPIFEHTKQDGSVVQLRGSSGGTHVLKYKTGQVVSLIIHDGSYGEEGTADDVGDRTGIYIGLVLIVIGSITIYFAANIFASLTIGLLAIVGITVSLIMRGKDRMKPKKVEREVAYDLCDMRPIEDFSEDAFE